MTARADLLRFWGASRRGDEQTQEEIKRKYKIKKGDVIKRLARLAERREKGCHLLTENNE